MAYYAESNYQSLASDDRSFLVATTNLLQKFGYTTTPDALSTILTSDGSPLDWTSLPRHFDGFTLHQAVDTSAWPTDRHAIGKFQRVDTKAAGMVDHYCLILDHSAGLIVDSLDGEIKTSPYGPIRSWASYLYDGSEDEVVAEKEEGFPPDPNSYRLKEGENLWDAAKKLNVRADTLIQLNELDDPARLPAGTELSLPVKTTKKPHQDITYRILAEPRPMHINHPAWTTKYMFGNVRKWGDIRPDKDHYKDGQNVDIYAVAKVPVEDTVAAYYMDKHDLGKYEETGRPAFTRGFNWQHLEEGHVEQKTKKTTPEMVAAIADQFDDRPEPVEAEVVPETVPDAPSEAVAVEAEEPVVSPIERELDDYKTSFRYLNIEESPELFRLLQDIDIREFDGQSEPIHKKADSTVKVIGWFTHENTPYLRVATRYWFGIPAHMAYSIEDDVFNEGIPKTVAERVASGGFLTDDERRLAAIARAAAKYQKLKRLPSLFRRK